jgi:pimeloyl-ACP methyl ester carboxylesterase
MRENAMARSGTVIALFFGLFGASAGAATPTDAMYTRPGASFTASDGARLNFHCMGQGSPAVVFDSGFLDWAPAWSVVQPRIAQFTRACSYDRAGAGFSGPPSGPMTLERIATELHSALHSGGVTGPYILVAQASGGNHIRAFADLFPDEVAGLVLVDADAGDVDLPENRAADDRGLLGFVPRLMACRDKIAAGQPDATLPASNPANPPLICKQLFFRGFPEVAWSSALNAKLLDIGGRNLAMWDADISEAMNIPAGETWLQQHRRDLGSRPVRILTSGNHGVHDLARPAAVNLDQLKYQYDRALAQSRWLTLSSDARQIFVQRSSEYIQFDQPDVVVEAIAEVYERARSGRPSGNER